MVNYRQAGERETWTVVVGMGVFLWADGRVGVRSREGRVILPRALTVALVKRRVAVILLVIAISDSALKA
jgi:hypothetical protein